MKRGSEVRHQTTLDPRSLGGGGGRRVRGWREWREEGREGEGGRDSGLVLSLCRGRSSLRQEQSGVQPTR
jgi:hypothetical protein